MAMKITLSAAMRARDVSRPQPGDLTQAEEADATSARAPRVAASGPRGTGRDRSPSAASQQRGPSPAPGNTGASNTGASSGSAGSAGSTPPAGRALDSAAEVRPGGGNPAGSSLGSTRPPRPAEGRRRRRRR